MLRVHSTAVFVIALACYACGGSAAPPPATGSTPAASATPASTASPASTSSSGAEFGVVECDDYIKKYTACIEKLAPAAKASARQALDQTKASWKQAASTEQGKAALAAGCKAVSDASAPQMRAQGCTW
jgi:hypothetical protein